MKGHLPPPSCIGLPAMLRSPVMTALRAKYGKYVPHQRANVDQVPLPFVNDMETTYEEVGAKRVCICCSRRPEGKGSAADVSCCLESPGVVS